MVGGGYSAVPAKSNLLKDVNSASTHLEGRGESGGGAENLAGQIVTTAELVSETISLVVQLKMMKIY